MLVRLLYASRCAGAGGNVPASPAQANALAESILQQSREYNPQHGITGILCQGGDVFLQVLEGGRGEVNALYQRIVRDPRHRQVTLLHYEEITEREFASWTMGQVQLSRINPSTLLKYSERTELDPFTASGKASLALLQELIATASIIGRA